MDGRRFDALVRELGAGMSRRGVLRGLLGIGGGVALANSSTNVEAARRPTPTPKPVQCPGEQHWNGQECVCPDGTEACGPDCCTPGLSECCDNACCWGTCYAEERCCPSPRVYCPATDECCPDGWRCCPGRGCLPPDQCCDTADCPDQDCHSKICTVEGSCAYEFDCSTGPDCCEAQACFRVACDPETGQCGEPVFDCTQEAPGACCGDGQVCLGNGSCCTPSCGANACSDDGCGGVCHCESGACCTDGQGNPYCASSPSETCCPSAAPGDHCVPKDGSGGEGICQDDLRCCVPSGGFAGGSLGNWCAMANCCIPACDKNTGLCS